MTINAATNKSESFKRFIQWLAFGGDGTITENDRDAQRKVIKYNHTAHINRLGHYELDTKRTPDTLDYRIFARPIPERKKRMGSFIALDS